MKKIFLLSLIFFSCQNTYNEQIEVGSISILEYPKENDLQRWIEKDSQYFKVLQVRKYFENFVNDEFFEKEENKLKFNNLTWFDMLNYQKRYSDLLNIHKDNYEDDKELSKFVDSLIMTEYPKVDEFTQEVFKLGYN
jgi:hypothetical protein